MTQSTFDIALVLVIAATAVVLVIAIRGSLRRDARFSQRYAAASPEERVKLEPLRPRSLSWTWLNFHATSPRWQVAIAVALVAAVVSGMVSKWLV